MKRLIIFRGIDLLFFGESTHHFSGNQPTNFGSHLTVINHSLYKYAIFTSFRENDRSFFGESTHHFSENQLIFFREIGLNCFEVKWLYYSKRHFYQFSVNRLTIFRGIDFQFLVHRNQGVEFYMHAKFEANRRNFFF